MPAPHSAADPRLVDVVALLTRPGGGVLHLGATDGALVSALLARGLRARGVERDVRAIHPAGDGLMAGNPLELPLDDASYFTVVVSSSWFDSLDEQAWRRTAAEISRVSADTLIVVASVETLVVSGDAQRPNLRTWWEQRFLEAGFRRHSRSLGIVDFESLEEDAQEAMLLLQKLPPPAAEGYPLGALAPERDLHMDMLRETGRRADAHIARYEWARGWVRPGDVVVDAACGLGYGSALLWDGSEAARVVGLDISETAVAYARANYADRRPGVEFRASDVEPWKGWPDASVDCIVSFETLEHLVDPHRFVTGARRVLKPGGRFLCSVPHAWVDESGRDPNPHHLHVFDLERLVQAVSPLLLIDQIYAQSAGGHADRFAPRRLLRDVGWPETDSGQVGSAEWLLLSAIRDPLETEGAVYTETVFPSGEGAVPNAIAFSRDYANPWAVHALVMGSFRVRSAHLLTALASRWLAASLPDSADAGAALCVLAYRQLDTRSVLPLEADELERRIRDYCTQPATQPQVRRWQISLLFVLGQVLLRKGDTAEAERVFRACAARNATAFTPHLETKTTEAAWLAGRLALERGDAASAAADWAGVAAALDRLKSASVAEWLITPDRPAAFERGDGLREITLAIDNATLCANGLRRLHDPSGAWRPGSEPADRNHQRNVRRLLDCVDQRGGEIVSLRAALESAATALHRAHESSRVAREALGELARCRAERAALLARLRTERAGGDSDDRIRAGIFGTGAAAMAVWEALSGIDDVTVAWFADNDASRHGQTLLWIEVIAPADLPSRPVDAVVIGSMHIDAIGCQLRQLGISGDRVLTPRVGSTIDELRDELRQALEQMQLRVPARSR